MPYGLLPTGFAPQTLEVIREEINASLRSAFGQSIDLSDGSILGHLVGILSERYAVLWELGETVYASQDPDGATGAALDALCSLTGTIRNPATESAAALVLTGTPTTVVPSGSTAETASTGVQFATLANATITALTAWAISTPYTLGQRRTNATRAYQVTIAGTSAGAGGPTTTAASIVDGTVTWTYLGEGTGAIDADAEATATGPLVGTARDITVIATPVGGWSSVINLLDADPGTDIESDEDLRVRRQLELSAAGESTADAIRANILEIEDVIACTVFVNNTDVTDVDGVPPHAVEALVRGGLDQDIFDMLLASVAAGIATYGTESGTAVDSAGTPHAIEFSRPDEIEIYVTITVLYKAADYPVDGDAQIEAAIVAYGDDQATGKNAVSSSIGAQAFTVPGVLDVVSCFISLAPGPTLPTTIPISLRELATFDTTRITVSSSPATP